jgi:hypothetical protein
MSSLTIIDLADSTHRRSNARMRNLVLALTSGALLALGCAQYSPDDITSNGYTTMTVHGAGSLICGSDIMACGPDNPCEQPMPLVNDYEQVKAEAAKGWHLKELLADGKPIGNEEARSKFGPGNPYYVLEATFERDPSGPSDAGTPDTGTDADDPPLPTTCTPSNMPTGGKPTITSAGLNNTVCRGNEVKIYGSNVGDVHSCVGLNNQPIPILRFDALNGDIDANVPLSGPEEMETLTLTTTGGSTSTSVFVFASPAPQATSLSNNLVSGVAGATVTVSGMYLGSVQRVQLHGADGGNVDATIVSSSSTMLMFTVPPGTQSDTYEMRFYSPCGPAVLPGLAVY